MSTSITVQVTDDVSPREPDATCDRCGARGTVARITEHTTPATVLRFCGPCWPEARRAFEAARDAHEAARRAQWAADPAHPPPLAPRWGMSSRVWSDVQEFLSMFDQIPDGERRPTAAELAQVAQEILADAPDMEGTMPADVAAFVRRHATPGTAA